MKKLHAMNYAFHIRAHKSDTGDVTPLYLAHLYCTLIRESNQASSQSSSKAKILVLIYGV